MSKMSERERVEYYTVAEAAAKLKVSPSTVRRWVKRGVLPSVQLDAAGLCIKRRDVEARLHSERLHTNAVGKRPKWEEMAEKYGIRPITDEEAAHALETIERLKVLHAEMLARRGGVPLAESWPDIREAREEESKRWR
jgi:excisionase family DNA binding protein